MKSDRQLLENHLAYVNQNINREHSEDSFIFAGEVNDFQNRMGLLSNEDLLKIKKAHIVIAGIGI